MKPYRHPPGLRAILRQLVAAACPPMPEGVDVTDEVIVDLEKTLGAMPGLVRSGFLAGAFAYEVAAIAWPGLPLKTASRLNEQQGLRYFEAWWHSPVGLQHEFARAAKGLLCLSYYETRAIRRHLGYTAEEWVEQVKSKRLAVHSDAIAAQEARLLAPDPLPTRFAASKGGRLAS